VGDALTYLRFELVWAVPVIAIQWVVGWRQLWPRRYAIGVVVGGLTAYLSAADRFAIASGIWRINPPRVSGAALFGLPLEEAIFFLCTNLMVVQALVLIQAHGRRLFALRATLCSQSNRSAVREGYRRGVRLALLGAIVSTIAGLVFGTTSGLEPVADVIVDATPLSIATVLLSLAQLAPSLPRALATLGGLAVFLLFGGIVGVVLAGQQRFFRVTAFLGVGAGGWLLLSAGPTDAPAAVRWAAPVALVFPLLLAAMARPTDCLGRPIAPAPPALSRRLSRRSMLDRLVLVGGAGLVTALPLAADRLATVSPVQQPVPGATPTTSSAATIQGLAVDDWGQVGLTPLVTPVEAFYRVSKNADDPRLDAARWGLLLGGAVDAPRRFTLDQLLGLPSIDVPVTLECVDNPVGGPLMSTAVWTGTRLVDLLDQVRPTSEATRLLVVGADGLDEDLPLDRLDELDPLLAYAMNGQPLPPAHGSPLRLIVPGYYGFKNVKWVVRIDLAGPGSDYWTRRGWSSLPEITSTARIDVARRDSSPGQASILVAGVALAGRRGVTRVELRSDRGAWVSAHLRAPPLGAATWVQWRAWILDDGSSEVIARVVDGLDRLPSEGPVSSFPAGASGWTRRRIDQ
jgi:lycopene cyclase domain-containing protein